MLSQLKEIISPNFVYHGEALRSRQHNLAVYSRVPRFHFILFDIYNLEESRYLDLDEMTAEAERVGLETVQVLYRNNDPNVEPYKIAEKLVKEAEASIIKSSLGGDIEGVVIKHPSYLDSKSKKVATKLKLVTDIFKEAHSSKRLYKDNGYSR